jgi:hypothetical protein
MPLFNREYRELADNVPKFARPVGAISPQALEGATIAAIGSGIGGCLSVCIIASLQQLINNLKKALDSANERLDRLERRLSGEERRFENIQPQSHEVGIGETPQEQNVVFRDYNPGFKTHINGEYDSVRDHAMANDASLDNFFRRPLRIKSYQWNVGDATPSWEGYMNPWLEYFNNPRVVNRIANYKLLRARLHLKFLINGTQFHFGRVLASYHPLFDDDDFISLIATREYACLESQRPHVFLNPTSSEGAEMTLPFFTPLNVLDITQTDWTRMGRVFLRQLNQLRHASGATDVVNISVFAWCEDIRFAVPTQVNPSNISPQSDEYSSRPISHMAGIVSRIATAVSEFPAIRPFALATSIGADAVGKVASLFGYSKPATIEQEIMRPITVRDLAVVNTKDDAQKLTLDVKQELTVDPRTVGLDGTDEMNINYVAGKESYLDTFDWSVTADPETLLWNTVVDPRNVLSTGSGATEQFFLPSIAFASVPFEQWRGSIKYRFQVVSCGFHKGRLKFVYDPSGTPTGDAEYNTAYTTIVDISQETDFTVCVGWGQSTSYRNCMPFPSKEYGTTRQTWSPVDVYGNGTLSVYVVNELAVPSVVDGDIEINVFVSGCDDIEFANPSDAIVGTLKYRQPQSSEIEPQSSESTIGNEMTEASTKPVHDSEVATMGENTDISDQTNHIHYGEVIRSFRSLVKRYVFSDIVQTVAFANLYMSNQNYRSAMPRNGGFVTLGTAPNHTISGTRNYSYWQTNYLTFITQAYAGWRGTIRHMYKQDQFENAEHTYTVVRKPEDLGDNDLFTDTGSTLLPAAHQELINDMIKRESAGQGAMMLSSGNNVSAVFEVPYQKRFRFCPARQNLEPVKDIDTYQNGYFVNRTAFYDSTNAASIPCLHYVAAGEDFTTFFFVGCPPVYRVVSEPV